MPERTFARLPPEDLAEVIGALAAAGLPTADIDGARMTFFRLADERGPLGWAALERRGSDALLRSVLTAPDRRSGGVGTALVRRVTALAFDEGIERLWLLTETAAPFFARLGFVEVPRAEAPAALRETTEFRSICPASATCMALTLARP
jgi:amino-acid N-acetyltransferase